MTIKTTGGEEYIIHFGGRHSGDVKLIWSNRYEIIHQSDYSILYIIKNQKEE